MVAEHDPNLETLLAHPATPVGIVASLSKPIGSKFYRCSFQVNPFDYTQRHAKVAGSQTEAEYNDAIAEACVDKGIQIVAITDHFRFDGSVIRPGATQAKAMWFNRRRLPSTTPTSAFATSGLTWKRAKASWAVGCAPNRRATRSRHSARLTTCHPMPAPSSS